MPKPVPPTVNQKPLIERLKKTLKVRTRDQPTLRAHIGVENMRDEELAENARAVLDAVEHRLEGLSKVRSIHLKTTMGKPVKVEV